MLRRATASLLILSFWSGEFYSLPFTITQSNAGPTTQQKTSQYNSQNKKEDIQRLLQLIDKIPKDHLGNVGILERAKNAYSLGDSKKGDLLLTRYLLQHENESRRLSQNDNELKEIERLTLIDFLYKNSPAQLVQYAVSVVHGMKAGLKQVLDEEKKTRGWVESASWIRNGLLEYETERAIDFVNMILIRLNEKNGNQKQLAYTFMKELRKFLPVFVGAKEGIAYRYRSIQDRVLLLSTFTYRFYTHKSFKPKDQADRAQEIQLQIEIGKSDASENITRAVWSRENLKAINPVVAIVGAITIEILTAGTATPFIAALAAGSTAAITAASLTPYAADMADALKLGGLSELSATDKVITFGLAVFALVIVSKKIKIPESSRVGIVLKTVQKSKAAEWGAKFLTTAKTIGTWTFFAGSFAYGSYTLANAESIANKTGEPVWKVRLDATLLMVCGVLGGWKRMFDLKSAAKKSLLDETTAAAKKQNTSSEARTLTQADGAARIRNFMSRLKGCLKTKSPAEMAKLLNGNLGMKAAISGSAIIYGLGTGKLRLKDLPIEISGFILRRASGRITSQFSVDPNTTYLVKYLRVGGVQGGLSVADGIIYIVTDKVIQDQDTKSNEDLTKYISTRTGYNLGWAGISTAQGIMADQLMLGLQCLYPLTPATMIPHTIANYSVSTAWSMFYYAGRDHFVGQ